MSTTTTTSTTTPVEPDRAVPPAVPSRRRRWLRTGMAAAAAVTAAGVAAAAALGVLGGGGGGTPAASNLPPATAEIVRTTLVATEEFDGTLGYGEATAVTVAATGPDGTGGVITWRPGLGETIERGEPVYAVNAEPVILMYGSMPFFRSPGDGDSGADVAQLEQNLVELGYRGFTVDDEYGWATSEAVEQWQADAGLPDTGRLDPARVVVAPGAIRVAEHLAPLGGTATGQVLMYTGTSQVVTVDLDVADQQLVAEELPVTVTLPDGSPVQATVSSVGTVATSTDDETGTGLGQQAEDGTTTIEVMVTVDDPAALGGWDAAPVGVTLAVDRREGVLAVPVGALVALAEGGYGVQLVDGDRTRYVAVETGMFAGGLVEVSGAEIAEGLPVGVPA